MYICIYIYIYVCLYLPLSLSIYIYIDVYLLYIHNNKDPALWGVGRGRSLPAQASYADTRDTGAPAAPPPRYVVQYSIVYYLLYYITALY